MRFSILSFFLFSSSFFSNLLAHTIKLKLEISFCMHSIFNTYTHKKRILGEGGKEREMASFSLYFVSTLNALCFFILSRVCICVCVCVFNISHIQFCNACFKQRNINFVFLFNNVLLLLRLPNENCRIYRKTLPWENSRKVP